MTDKKIIYPTDDGGIAIIIPALNCGLTVEEIASKDVPAGKPFKIINSTDIPNDRTFRAAWEADMTLPDGIGIGQKAWFINKYNADIAEINAETPPAKGEEQDDEQYALTVSQWDDSKRERIEQLNSQIATQQSEAAE